MNMKLRLVLAITAILAAAPARADEPGDAARGLALAQDRCARCHVIDKGGAFKQMPPTFQAIAIYRTPDDIFTRIMSPNPHSSMPNVAWNLLPDEVQDIMAYIVSLDVPVTLPAQ